MNNIEFLKQKIKSLNCSQDQRDKFLRVLMLANETEIDDIVNLVKEEDSLLSHLIENVTSKYSALLGGSTSFWEEITQKEKAYLEGQ